jgi:hypothetical protein
MGGHKAHMGEITSAHKILVGRPPGKKPCGRPRCRWGYNIRTDLREIGWKGVNSMELVLFL